MRSPNLLRAFHDVSPYEGHDVAAHPADLQGWGSNDPIFRYVLATLRPQVIIEVGTWKGASAIHMGLLLRELGIPGQIVCVDTWLGSPEHFIGHVAAWRQSLRLQNGYPRLYFTFLTNVIEHGLTDVIVPLPATSENAAAILAYRKISADVVYIDGAHEFDAVKRDISKYWGLLSEHGAMIGDDYQQWPGVTQAANEFAKENALRLAGRPGKFVLSKNSEFFGQMITAAQEGKLS